MNLTAALATMLDLALVIAGFTLIIVVHELGHFLAARWAGIRVLAFAVGFGPAIVSFRKGLGWRRGSSEPAFRALPATERASVSPTEYRLNVLPLGGYVKMLGQDDADPSARSDEADSYQRAPVHKRMVVISAGVVANLILAVLLYIAVFSAGLKTEPAIIGSVEPDSPAASSIATNAKDLNVTEPGLLPGDEILSANGARPDSFNDLQLAVAMSARAEPVRLEVRREGVPELLRFEILPRVDETSRMLAIGAAPMRSTRLSSPRSAGDRAALQDAFNRLGFAELAPGMTLSAVNGAPARSAFDLTRAVDQSAGAPVRAEFRDPSARVVSVTITPAPLLMQHAARVDDRTKRPFSHLLGLTPVLGVHEVVEGSAAQKAGILPGDVFVQIGSLEWPSLVSGIDELRARKGERVRIAVARADQAGLHRVVELGDVQVSSAGTLGFHYFGEGGEAGERSPIVSRWPSTAEPPDQQHAAPRPPRPSGATIALPPGARLISVNAQPVTSISDVRRVLQAAARALPKDAPAMTVDIEFAPLLGPGAGEPARLDWSIPRPELDALLKLGYASPLSASFFEPSSILLRGDNVLDSVAKGFKETHRVMIMTYLTFARLFEGTVKIEHLKGPVGIAHIGVVIADRGAVWLLFFMALISVNLAVINFLPLPIVDGGHMVYLIYERLTGKQPPVAFQNAAALVGLVLIGTMFLIVTFHDISGVISRIFG